MPFSPSAPRATCSANRQRIFQTLVALCALAAGFPLKSPDFRCGNPQRESPAAPSGVAAKRHKVQRAHHARAHSQSDEPSGPSGEQQPPSNTVLAAPGRKLSSGVRKTWQKRHFVLVPRRSGGRGAELAYYNAAPSTGRDVSTRVVH